MKTLREKYNIPRDSPLFPTMRIAEYPGYNKPTVAGQHKDAMYMSSSQISDSVTKYGVLVMKGHDGFLGLPSFEFILVNGAVIYSASGNPEREFGRFNIRDYRIGYRVRVLDGVELDRQKGKTGY